MKALLLAQEVLELHSFRGWDGDSHSLSVYQHILLDTTRGVTRWEVFQLYIVKLLFLKVQPPFHILDFYREKKKNKQLYFESVQPLL